MEMQRKEMEGRRGKKVGLTTEEDNTVLPYTLKLLHSASAIKGIGRTPFDFIKLIIP